MVHLYSDLLGPYGGIESYLHALSLKLKRENIPFEVWVCETEPSPIIDDLMKEDVSVHRQGRVFGDQWRMRQRVMIWKLCCGLKAGDWVYCVREPMEQVYLSLVRAVHRKGAKLAVSWMLSPRLLEIRAGYESKFARAVAETDAVISVSKHGVPQFSEVYGYKGDVSVVRYHNISLFDDIVPLPKGPPWKFGYMGRLNTDHKNLDGLLEAFEDVAGKRQDVELHIYGSGTDEKALQAMTAALVSKGKVFFHGAYDHRNDLPGIMQNCHIFMFPSRREGGPSFVLLEYLQAGRYCIASSVGGAPDVYGGRDDTGLLVEPGDGDALVSAMLEAVGKVERGEIDPYRIRARYFEEFDMAKAHDAWLKALDMEETA